LVQGIYLAKTVVKVRQAKFSLQVLIRNSGLDESLFNSNLYLMEQEFFSPEEIRFMVAISRAGKMVQLVKLDDGRMVPCFWISRKGAQADLAAQGFNLSALEVGRKHNASFFYLSMKPVAEMPV